MKENPIRTDDSNSRRHIGLVFATCAIVLLSAGGFNSVVDPYLRFEWYRSPGINQYRPAAVGQVRMAKSYQSLRIRPVTVVLGNSRVDLGINPRSPYWPKGMEPVYNAGQPGGGMWTNLRYLQHVSADGNVRHAILGCDFFDFFKDQTTQRAPPVSHRSERRLVVTADGRTNTGRWRQSIADTVYGCFSMSALLDGMQTILKQGSRPVADIDSHGQTSGEPFRTIIARQGQYSLVQEKNEEYFGKLHRPGASLFEHDGGDSFAWTTFDRILRHCEASQIQLTVFTHPYHTDILRLIGESGRWEDFQRWKRELSLRCGQSNSTVRLWDFACFHEVTSEALPSADDRQSVMDWYWESGHYRQETGDLMLRAIFGGPTDADATGNNGKSDTFGVSLTIDSIDDHLALQSRLLAEAAPSRDR